MEFVKYTSDGDKFWCGGQELHSRNQRPLVDGYSRYSQVVGLHFIFYTPDMPQVWNLDLIIKLLLWAVENHPCSTKNKREQEDSLWVSCISFARGAVHLGISRYLCIGVRISFCFCRNLSQISLLSFGIFHMNWEHSDFDFFSLSTQTENKPSNPHIVGSSVYLLIWTWLELS